MTRQSSDDMSDKHDDIHGNQVVIGRPGMGKTALMAHFMRMLSDNTACKIELKNENLNTLRSELEQKK
jgi:stage III sporulation protein SpoIIIAA